MNRFDGGAFRYGSVYPLNCLREISLGDPVPKRVESGRALRMVRTGVVQPAKVVGGKEKRHCCSM